MPHALNGLRVVSFESRRSAEMAELIRNYGGEPIQAPAMREVPLTDQREALAFGETLLAGDWDVLILLTGVGTRMLIAACATRWPKDEVVKALGRLTLVCRGPKRRCDGPTSTFPRLPGVISPGASMSPASG